MTNNQPLDEHIKEKFGNYTPDVPPHIWENIIAQKEKRRPIGFWFNFLNKNMLLLLLGILSTGTGIIIYKTVYSPAKLHSTATNQPVTTNTDQLNNHSSEADNNTVGSLSTEINSSNNIREGNISSTENKINESKHTTPADQNIAANKKKIGIPGNNNNSLSLSENNNKDQSPASIENNTTYSKPTRKQKHRKGSAVISYKNPNAISDDISATASDDLLLKRMLLKLDMIRIEKTFTASIKRINNPHIDIPCPEAEKNAAGNKRYFELYGGPDYAFRSITDTGNSAYMQKRKESSIFSSAFSVGLRYTKVFNNSMSFRTGINYSQINEKFKFAQGNIIQVVYIINNNGDTTGSYTTTGTRYKTTYNKFRTIDIPILIGYELGNGRIHANFNAGAIINLYSWQKGDVLDTAYQPVNITTGKTASPYQFKTNAGIGFIGAVSVYYKLNSKWHIFAEPYFRYNFSPASKADLTLKQKYSTAGLRLGIRLDF